MEPLIDNSSLQEDFANFPARQLFPSLCCQKPQLRSGALAQSREETLLDEYILSHQIQFKVNNAEDVGLIEDALIPNPIQSSGFGFIAFFRTMNLLALIFLIQALLMLPIGIANILDFPEKPPMFSLFDWMSTANIPYSENICIQQYVQINEPRIITCQLGGGRMGPIWSTGVISSDTPSNNLTQCPNTQVGPDLSQQIVDCSAQLNNQSLTAAYNQNCLGQIRCSINLSEFMPLSSGICADAPARVYIQYYCELTDKQFSLNQTTRAWATAFSIIAGILFLVGLHKHTYKIREAKAHHGQGLVNPAAFSVRLAITDTMWTELMQNYNGQEPQLIFAQKQLDFDDESIVCINWENLSGESIDHISNGNFDQVKQLPRPKAAYITFKTIELKRQALRNPMFKDPSSPFTIEWGNVDVSKLYKVIVFTLYVLFMIVYLVLCIFLQFQVKYYLVKWFFIYDFWGSCRYLIPQFNTTENFEYWADIDQNFIQNSQTLGIYQCYCSQKISTTTFYKIWTDPALRLCGQYAAMGMGGSLLTIPSGVINAVVANLGALLVTAFIKKIRFQSRHKQMHVTVISVFLITYINMGLTHLEELPSLHINILSFFPFNLTPYWLFFWGKAISVSLLVFNFMPYAGPGLKILCRRGICCCKRKDYKHNTFDNPPFAIERKYAQLLTTAFISSTYGYCLPILPTISFVSILGQYALDKLLIAYYYKPQVLQNDLLNRSVVNILQFTVVVFLSFAAYAQFTNYCQLENSTKTLVYSQEFRSCTGFSKTTYVLICAAAAVLVAVAVKTYFNKINQKDLIDSKNNYFERLSYLDRKRWVVEEHYRRSQLGVQTISDETFEQLCSSECHNFNNKNDPCNYSILSNQEYAKKFRYSGVVLALSEEERQRQEQITMAVFGAFQVANTGIQ